MSELPMVNCRADVKSTGCNQGCSVLEKMGTSRSSVARKVQCSAVCAPAQTEHENAGLGFGQCGGILADAQPAQHNK